MPRCKSSSYPEPRIFLEKEQEATSSFTLSFMREKWRDSPAGCVPQSIFIKLDIMTNYYLELPLQHWEKMATTACFETNQQVKSEAERFFHVFADNPNLNLIVSILNSGSPTLLFVLFSYLAKSPNFLLNNLPHFALIIQTLRSWQFRGFNFHRPNCPAFPNYVTRTIMTAVGIFLKVLYESSLTSKALMEYLKEMEADYFKLFMYKTFVEAIETVDVEMGYMRYRSMVYSFQDDVIPHICQTLMPFFYRIEEGVRISELSYLQQNLKVTELQTAADNSLLPISQQQQLQAQYVFMILKKIVEFNYNITYTEYESEQVIETCLITFPDSILEKIINYEFLNALFFIIEKVSEVKVGEKRNEYLSIGLDCLTKMMQSRLTYIDQDKKERYIVNSVHGLTHLLRRCKQIGSETLLEGILVCNKKLFINVELSYIKAVVAKYPDPKNAHVYQSYIRDLTEIIIIIVKRSYVNIDNHLLFEALQLSNKLMLSYGHKDEENMDQDYTFFMEFIKAVIDGFIENLCQSRSIFHGTTLVSLTQNKQAINQLFDLFKKLASYSYSYLFQRLLQAVEYFIKTSRNESMIISNILFLLSELVDHNFLERNIFLNKAKDSETAVLGVLVRKATEIINEYLSTRKYINDKKNSHYIDMAVLLFTEAIMIEFLIGFEGSDKFKIKQKLYLIMTFGQNYSDFYEPEDENSQTTIIVYINFLLQYLSGPINTPEEEAKTLYALEVIEKGIFKLKWNMKREIFIRNPIFKYLSEYFENLFFSFNTIMDVRSRAGKIMVSLTFDDVLDEYKFRINKFLRILKNQTLEVMLYDLIGIFEGIETNAISKYFCNRLKRTIDMKSFFEQIFKAAQSKNEEKMYRDVCRLCKSILLNKGLKISNSNIIYEIFNLTLPSLIWLLQTINSSTPINYDLWSDAIHQLLELLNGVINGTHINIFLLDSTTATENSPSLCKQFLIEFFKMLILIFSSNIRTYPKMEEGVLNLIFSINKEILDYIYSDQSGALSQIYNLTTMVAIQGTVQYISLLLDGNRVIEDKVIKSIDSLRLFYIYFNRKCKMVHKKTCLSNLKKYYDLSENFRTSQGLENKNERLIFYLISFILTNHKNNISYLRTITKFIYELNKNFKVYILRTFQKLNIPPHRIAQISSVLNNEAEQQESFIEHFKTWVKEFSQFK